MATELSTKSLNQELDSALQRLDGIGDVMPLEAFEVVQRNRNEAIPFLIQAIQDAVAEARRGKDVESARAFFSLFLLTEMKAREAFPVILDAYTLDDDGLDNVFGDGWTQIGATLFSAMTDDPDAHEAIARDASRLPMVRSMAAEALEQMIQDGRITRSDALTRLRGLLRDAIAEQDNSHLVSFLVSIVSSVGAEEAQDDLRRAFDLDLVDPMFIQRHHVEQYIADWKKEFDARQESIRLLRREDWTAALKIFYHSDRREDDEEFDDEYDVAEWQTAKASLFGSVDPFEMSSAPVEQLHRITPKIGRNEPCPCGSGKKYKKCCGAPD
jgi:hypothetical protein